MTKQSLNLNTSHVTVHPVTGNDLYESASYLNTSHVTVHRINVLAKEYVYNDLNTSHVTVHRKRLWSYYIDQTI